MISQHVCSVFPPHFSPSLAAFVFFDTQLNTCFLLLSQNIRDATKLPLQLGGGSMYFRGFMMEFVLGVDEAITYMNDLCMDINTPPNTEAAVAQAQE